MSLVDCMGGVEELNHVAAVAGVLGGDVGHRRCTLSSLRRMPQLLPFPVPDAYQRIDPRRARITDFFFLLRSLHAHGTVGHQSAR